MDNNKKVQISNMEYKNMNTVSPVNPIRSTTSEVNTHVYKDFKELIKKEKNCTKKKKTITKDSINEDLVVENSLKELIKKDHEVNKTVELRITESTLIKKLLSNEEITPSIMIERK